MKVLSAVQRELGIPVVLLGEMVPAPVLTQLVGNLGPRMVLVWSMIPYPVDLP
ncbi:hypothetical protein [Amycolatopsis sp. NPDC004378]